MLPPDSRTTAFELIRPPSGYRLDFAVLTTYTLDLEALLVLPLSVAHGRAAGRSAAAAPGDPRRRRPRACLRRREGHRDSTRRASAVLDARVERASRARPERRRLPSQGVGGPVHGGGRSGGGSAAGCGAVPESQLRPFLGRRPGERSPAAEQAVREEEPAAARLPVGAAATRHRSHPTGDRRARRDARRSGLAHCVSRPGRLRVADRVPCHRTDTWASDLEPAVEWTPRARGSPVRQPDGARRGRQAERKRPDTGEPAGGARQAVRRRARRMAGDLRPVGYGAGRSRGRSGRQGRGWSGRHGGRR